MIQLRHIPSIGPAFVLIDRHGDGAPVEYFPRAWRRTRFPRDWRALVRGAA